MTYLQFHLLFIVPPLVVLAVLALPAGGRLGRRGGWAVWSIPPIALLYTTPWDNYLVWRQIWWYGADRVVGTLGWVPIEEYLFFLLQPLATGFLFYVLLARSLARGSIDPGAAPRGLRRRGIWTGVVLAALGAILLGREPGTYLGLILVWAVPVVTAMWGFMAPAIWRARRPASLAIMTSTAYLWVADRIAIGAGIWEISDRFTLGFDPLGLPVEEATFFLVTNVLCVFGLVLFLAPGIPALREVGRP